MLIQQFIKEALECSVFVAPRDYGLDVNEIREAGARAGYRPGEINDALASPLVQRRGSRCVPTMMGLNSDFSVDFIHQHEPSYRNPHAFEFVRDEMDRVTREVGRQQATIDRDILVERGVAAGHDRKAMEIAITVSVFADVFEEIDGKVRPGRNAGYARPSQQMNRMGHTMRNDTIARTNAIVEDVIKRRTDGRPSAANAVDAFETLLGSLGHDRFRSWWVQRRSELRLSNPAQQPTTILVLAASLAEGALAFVVPRAQANGLMTHIDVNKPRQWRFDDLVKGSKSSNPSLDPILDDRTAQRALDLNGARQRIHAGYLIDTVPTGPIPDLKPEEAKDAVQTMEALIRKVVDWLGRHP